MAVFQRTGRDVVGMALVALGVAPVSAGLYQGQEAAIRPGGVLTITINYDKIFVKLI